MSDIIRILLVDDDEDDYLIAEDLLEDIKTQEYELDWIPDYDTALDVIRDNRHEAYIIDYRLGAQTGLDLVHASQEDGIHRPFILLTGQGDIETDERAMKAGAFDYMVKGEITSAQLERSIRHSIQHSKNIQKIRSLNERLEERVRKRTRMLDKAIQDLQLSNEYLQKQISERAKAEEALLKSQHIYRTIANNFPNGIICVLDIHHHIVFADGKELGKLEVNVDELIGKNVHEFSALPLNNQQALQLAFKGEESMYETQVNHKQYSVSVVPFPVSKGGVISQVMCVAIDISNQKNIENEIKKALQREKELNELKSRFVSMASHEFRTPLSTILSSASLIARYPEAHQQEKRDKHIERIKSSVNNLTQILNDFLSLSKMEEGKTMLHLSTFELSQEVQSICEEMYAVKKIGQSINYQHEGEEIICRSDKQVIKNILINLLSNAIKYSSAGKTIWVRTHQKGDHLCLSVKDEGIGIPKSEQGHLFERFFRAENATNIQGTGLGLHIVKKYVDLIKGDISFDSQLDEGTTFKISLPQNIR
ncbi:sensor histidine kinase [Algivirga pacifica]|uniref:histidine kinase n=1 Tax=Algivirga pacifica TaxID=1162670 RepID=A0ABP9DBU3_9BACT